MLVEEQQGHLPNGIALPFRRLLSKRFALDFIVCLILAPGKAAKDPTSNLHFFELGTPSLKARLIGGNLREQLRFAGIDPLHL